MVPQRPHEALLRLPQVPSHEVHRAQGLQRARHARGLGAFSHGGRHWSPPQRYTIAPRDAGKREGDIYTPRAHPPPEVCICLYGDAFFYEYMRASL